MVVSQKNASPVRRREAFTLVEMLAVITVMLIILKLTLPSLDGILGVEAQGMGRLMEQNFRKALYLRHSCTE